jgi:hypothetical protein
VGSSGRKIPVFTADMSPGKKSHGKTKNPGVAENEKNIYCSALLPASLVPLAAWIFWLKLGYHFRSQITK